MISSFYYFKLEENMIDFKSINFGESDADTEALRTPLDFNEVFFDPNNYLEELMRGYRYIVRGRKGDGKTAYGAKIKLLTEKTEDYAFKRSLLNFNNTTFSNIKTCRRKSFYFILEMCSFD